MLFYLDMSYAEQETYYTFQLWVTAGMEMTQQSHEEMPGVIAVQFLKPWPNDRLMNELIFIHINVQGMKCCEY